MGERGKRVLRFIICLVIVFLIFLLNAPKAM